MGVRKFEGNTVVDFTFSPAQFELFCHQLHNYAQSCNATMKSALYDTNLLVAFNQILGKFIDEPQEHAGKSITVGASIEQYEMMKAIITTSQTRDLKEDSVRRGMLTTIDDIELSLAVHELSNEMDEEIMQETSETSGSSEGKTIH